MEHVRRWGKLSDIARQQKQENTVKPAFFRLPVDEDKVFQLLKEKPFIRVHDTIKSQLEELIQTLHPAVRLSEEKLKTLMGDRLGDSALQEYGVWVYYPWKEELVHILDREEFILLRTNRNRYKITEEEQRILSTKKIGIIGLSVGQSVALTLAMERGFGTLRIADFDTLDLSNLNRLRAGVHQLGLPKSTLVAREIAEIDPFLEVTCFQEGIREENLEAFLLEDGKLDLLIDECDSLDIKILSRQKARENQIPVLMDTSDRGMIDIERFDLEPTRPILHGLMGDMASFVHQLKDSTQRVQLSIKIAGGDGLSQKMKESVAEIGKSISTWPQLASEVIIGGAVAAQTSRKILLKEKVPSGRFYVDVEQIVGHQTP